MPIRQMKTVLGKNGLGWFSLLPDPDAVVPAKCIVNWTPKYFVGLPPKAYDRGRQDPAGGFLVSPAISICW